MSTSTTSPAKPASGCTSPRLRARRPPIPAPGFDVRRLSGRQGVRTVALDSPSIGAFGEPDYVMRGPQSANQTPRGIESHLGLFKHGGIDIEGLINFDKVPNGSLFIGLPVKHVGARRQPRCAPWRSPTPSLPAS